METLEYKYQVWFRKFKLNHGEVVIEDGKAVILEEIDKGVIRLNLNEEQVLSPENSIEAIVGTPPKGYSLNYVLVS